MSQLCGPVISFSLHSNVGHGEKFWLTSRSPEACLLFIIGSCKLKPDVYLIIGVSVYQAVHAVVSLQVVKIPPVHCGVGFMG